MKRWLAVVGVAAVVTAAAPRPCQAINVELWVPDGVPRLRAVLAFTSVGIGPDWGRSPDFQDLARRLQAGIAEITDEDAFGAYLDRCVQGGFQPLLDKLAEVGAAQQHPELAQVPIIGCGHSHGGDYWNYFNACYPQRVALVFDKSSGGVQYSGQALDTPMIWEVGTSDARNSKGNFRAEMFAHRSKGSPLTLVMGQGEDHTTLTPGPRQLVIDLIEAIFKLRVPADADPTTVSLRKIDEPSGAYWLGDNYSRQVGAWATFPGRDALPRRGSPPGAELAARGMAAVAPLAADIHVDAGTCTPCYPQPPAEPGARAAPDGGAPGDGAASTPVAARSSGGCAVGGSGAGGLLVLVLVVALAGRRRPR